MIKSIGIDIVQTSRIEKDLERFGDRFIDKILGPKERELVVKRADLVQFIAGRFAAKEAITKCLGVLLSVRPALSTLQIINDEQGQPKIETEGELAKLLSSFNIQLSITHEREYAAAVAVLEE